MASVAGGTEIGVVVGCEGGERVVCVVETATEESVVEKWAVETPVDAVVVDARQPPTPIAITRKRGNDRLGTSSGYGPLVLRERLVDRIREAGPIPFEEYMALALYHPEGGFFTGGPLRSARQGDFLTSPEVSPLFGGMLARFAEAERERLGLRECFAVVDFGAGSGSLLRPLVGALRRPAEVWAVEVSEAARLALAELLPPQRVVGSWHQLPERLTGVILANELLDNLPAALAVRKTEGWEERWVDFRDGELVLVPVSARSEVADWAERFGGPVPLDGQVEVQRAAGAWLGTALDRLVAGAAVVIDYGDTASGLASRRPEGSLRTYQRQHLGPDPLLAPGHVDITMDVNFTALSEMAAQQNASVELLSQAAFLERLGLRDELGRLRDEELTLAREGEWMERLRTRSRVKDGETLLHPRGLGDFRVLVARPRSGTGIKGPCVKVRR
ncbi:MAG: SAM-dependent methyltransferase [Actinomycetota bacterium]|nr:SAM-dependent methyltransferase [Actinomycetota bacterium]